MPTESAGTSKTSIDPSTAAPSGHPDDRPALLSLVRHPEQSDGEAGLGAVPAAEESLSILEALLFASDIPLGLGKICELLEIAQTPARLLLAELNDRYTASGASFRVVEIARGYQLMTLPKFAPWISRLHKQRGEAKLSDAAMETLSIIAYRQPIIRADIEAIRGVACGDSLNRLREMGLVRVAGRAEVVGRPMLYASTRKFLEIFGLADLKDLPPMEALKFRERQATVAPPAEPPVAEPPLRSAASA